MAEKSQLLLTGSSGLIAKLIHPLLAKSYNVVGIDLVSGNQTDVVGDIADYATLSRVMDGVDTVVHLAAIKHDLPFEVIKAANYDGTQNIFRAAEEFGVRRVIFASSVRIDDLSLVIRTGEYPNPAYYYNPEYIEVPAQKPKRRFSEADMPKPQSPYGYSKAYGELLGRWFAERTGGTAVSIRFGAVQTSDDLLRIKQELNMFLRFCWLSHRDLSQGIEQVLSFQEPGHHVFYMVSNNERNVWIPEGARQKLGYTPQDNVEKFAPDLQDVFMRPTGKM